MEGQGHRRNPGARLIIAALITLAIAGCSSGQAARRTYTAREPSTHIVQPGETIYHIAQHYGVSVASLMSANRIADPGSLRVGQRLVIPGSYRYASIGADSSTTSALDRMWNVPRANRQFAWPVYSGVVSSGFGIRHGTMHDGVDIAAPVGTPVHAAGDGTVVFAGRLHGYGNTVIIRHDDQFVTVYGHDERNFVAEGQRVVAGQTIGEIGTTGRTTGPNLHFEIRYDNLAYNPLSYLPPPGPGPAESFARNGAP